MFYLMKLINTPNSGSSIISVITFLNQIIGSPLVLAAFDTSFLKKIFYFHHFYVFNDLYVFLNIQMLCYLAFLTNGQL